MRPYDVLDLFYSLPENEMPPLSDEDERAEIDRLLGIVYEEMPEDYPQADDQAA